MNIFKKASSVTPKLCCSLDSSLSPFASRLSPKFALLLLALAALLLFSCSSNSSDSNDAGIIDSSSSAMGHSSGGGSVGESSSSNEVKCPEALAQRGLCPSSSSIVAGSSSSGVISGSSSASQVGESSSSNEVKCPEALAQLGLCPSSSSTIAFSSSSAGQAVSSSSSKAQSSSSSYDKANAPAVSANGPASITYNSATLNGTVSYVGSPSYAEKGFCYGTNSAPTKANSTCIMVEGTEKSFLLAIENLNYGTKYYFRPYIFNDSNFVQYGAAANFTTLGSYPSISISPASNLITVIATLNANVTNVGNPNAYTEKGFCYGTTLSSLTKENSVCSAVSGTASGAFSLKISALMDSTRYYARAYIQNADTLIYSGAINFSTSSSIPLIHFSNFKFYKGGDTVGLHIKIDNPGYPSYTDAGICYGVNENPSKENGACARYVGDGYSNVIITKLEPSTKYYFRAYINNGVHPIHYDEVGTFLSRAGEFTDSRDGEVYSMVTIGNKTWMAKNLNYKAAGSTCYQGAIKNCNAFGRLYDWSTALLACPDGWHLPSDAEWTALIDYVGESSTAGKKLKVMNNWEPYSDRNGDGTDDYGFSAEPGGFGNSNGIFYNLGSHARWWSATDYNDIYAYYRLIDEFGRDFHRAYNEKTNLSSIRCVRD